MKKLIVIYCSNQLHFLLAKIICLFQLFKCECYVLLSIIVN